jgi:hypothetical protein
MEYVPSLPGEQGEGRVPGSVDLEAAIGTAVLLAALLTLALGIWPGPITKLVSLVPLG